MKKPFLVALSITILLALTAQAQEIAPAAEAVPAEAAPAVTEAAPAVTEAAPAVTEAAPAVTEAAPAVTEAAPTVTEAAPTVTEAAPTAPEAAPAPEVKQISTSEAAAGQAEPPTVQETTVPPPTNDMGQSVEEPYIPEEDLMSRRERWIEYFHDGILAFSKAEYMAAIHARIQIWGGWVDEDSLLSNGDKMQEPGLRLRRARLGLDGSFPLNVTYGLFLELLDTEATGGPLYQAWVDWTPIHYFGLTLGVDKFLLMRSSMMSSALMPHLDRPLSALAFSPSNALGAIIHTEPWKEHLLIQGGVYNGLRRKASFHEGYEGVGVTLGNRYEGMAYAARLDLIPLDRMGPDMADTDKLPSFRMALGAGFFYNDGSSIVTWGYSTYLHLKAYGLHLFGEYTWDKVEPQEKPTTTDTVSTTMKRMAACGSLGYVIVRNLLGVAARFEYLDDNMDQSTEGDEWLITGTLNFYALGDYLKAQVEYTHREEMYGLKAANDYVIAGVQLYF